MADRSIKDQAGKIFEYLILFGEPAGTRTRDLLIKSQLLCQLSYGLLGALGVL